MLSDSFFPRLNGVTVSVQSYAEGLTELGTEVCVVCLDYSEVQQKKSNYNQKKDKKMPFKIVRIPGADITFSKEDRMVRLDKWYRIKRELDNFRPDVIHINTEFTIAYLGAIYCRHRHVPFVYTFHTLWEQYFPNYLSYMPSVMSGKIGKELIIFYLKRADLIITPTKEIQAKVAEYGIQRETYILPTGISSKKFKVDKNKEKKKKAKILKKYSALKGKKILLFVGRVVKEKNLDFLLDAFEKIHQRMPETALLIVGDGPHLEALKASAKERNLKKSVVFTGYQESNETVYFYKTADIFTFPSKTETQGLVTIEAMLSGLPVVAIGEMGTVNVMKGDNGGFMVKDNLDEFVEKTLLLLQDKDVYKQKKKEALAWGEQWKISTLTPRLVELYEKAIKICNEKK